MSDVGYVEPNIRYKYTDYYQMVFKKTKKILRISLFSPIFAVADKNI